MNSEPKRWPTFDAETLTPLNKDELSRVDAACNSFNEGFNNVYSYQWKASPFNLADLDYDFYEFGGEHWYRDNGYGFTCAWGQILVTSFGFQWMKMEGARDLPDWVLRHEDAFYIFFPWQTLWSVVESSGYQHEKAAGTWMRILNHVDEVYGLPKGWHIITDVLNGDIEWVPKRVGYEMQAIYNRPNWRFEILGLEPYGWDRDTDWDNVETYLNTKKKELGQDL